LTLVEGETLVASFHAGLASFRVEVFVGSSGALFNAETVEEEFVVAAFSAGSVLIADFAVFSALFANSVLVVFIGRADSDTSGGCGVLVSVHEVVLSAFVADVFGIAQFAASGAFLAGSLFDVSSIRAGGDAFAFEFETGIGAYQAFLFINREETAVGFFISAAVVDLLEDRDVVVGEGG